MSISRQRKKGILGCLFMAVFCTATMANNGLDTISFDEPRRFYVDCLAEYLAGTIYVTAKGHFFATASGNVHIVDNWTYTLDVTGESTGRRWISRRAVSPLTDNVSVHGEVLGFTDHAQMVPLDEGPKWTYTFNYKIRIDADGNVISEWSKFATDEFIRCLGPSN